MAVGHADPGVPFFSIANDRVDILSAVSLTARRVVAPYEKGHSIGSNRAASVWGRKQAATKASM